MRNIRIGVIGVGGMGAAHCKAVNDLKETALTCVCDGVRTVAEERGREYGVPAFSDFRKLLASGLADAVIVATPHWFHPEIAVCAMRAGLHVLSEKPIAVTVSGGRAMVEAARRHRRVFAVNHQMRLSTAVRQARRIVEGGLLGEIRRTLFVSAFLRTQAYYDSGTWRATWAGEGGGVMVNQAPHGIDVFLLLGGLPSLVDARTRSRMHDIEVEDEAVALLEYPNGSRGYFSTSTCEPDTFRMEFVGEKGKLVLGDTGSGGIRFFRFQRPLTEFVRTAAGMWDRVAVKEARVPAVRPAMSGHEGIIRNFARAIMGREELVSPGREGLHSLEFINAVLLSGNTRKPVALPVDERVYDRFIEKLRKASRPKKHVVEQRSSDPRILAGGPGSAGQAAERKAGKNRR